MIIFVIYHKSKPMNGTGLEHCDDSSTKPRGYSLKDALHIQGFEGEGPATKIDFFGSDCKRPRW